MAPAPALDWTREGSAIRPGRLRLWAPSLKLADYQFEFEGQIEQKAMSWTFRSGDLGNYYATKISVASAAPAPRAAIVRYVVLGGKECDRIELPLPPTVLGERFYHVKVNVKGSYFVTSVNGQVVDSWSDRRLTRGGVGFFADKGEVAAIRWVSVNTAAPGLLQPPVRLHLVRAAGPVSQKSAQPPATPEAALTSVFSVPIPATIDYFMRFFPVLIALLPVCAWAQPAPPPAARPQAERAPARPRLEAAAQRNENVVVYQIDTNAIKEADIRLGDTVTILTEPPAELNVLRHRTRAASRGSRGGAAGADRRGLARRTVRVAPDERLQRSTFFQVGECCRRTGTTTADVSPGRSGRSGG